MTRPSISERQMWSAVGSMALCVSLLIASEFMPVSLLTPIAADLRVTEGMAGQAISVSGLFAVITSLVIAKVAARFDRRHVLLVLTGMMLASLIVIAESRGFATLMVARSLLGVTIGGFWSLSTATVMRLVPKDSVPRALSLIYTGNAVATAFAAPLGSYFGGVIGWRGVFWALVPLVLVNLLWQWVSLPSIRQNDPSPVRELFHLLKRRSVAFGMIAVMLTFAGAFSAFTYFRPFLETVTRATVTQVSLLLLALGLAGFVGTYLGGRFAGTRLTFLLRWMPVGLAAITLSLLVGGHSLWSTAAALFAWGVFNSAIPVVWSTWQTRAFADKPESGGGLMVAAIQIAITLGAGFGGLLLDHFSISATFIGGAALLVLASLTVGYGDRVSPALQTNESRGENL